MSPPIEFRKIVRLFLQGSLESARDMPEFISSAVRLLEPDLKPTVKSFVSDLLASNMSERELHEMWISCSPNYWIDEGKMRKFLTAIFGQLE